MRRCSCCCCCLSCRSPCLIKQLFLHIFEAALLFLVFIPVVLAVGLLFPIVSPVRAAAQSTSGVISAFSTCICSFTSLFLLTFVFSRFPVVLPVYVTIFCCLEASLHNVVIAPGHKCYSGRIAMTAFSYYIAARKLSF